MYTVTLRNHGDNDNRKTLLELKYKFCATCTTSPDYFNSFNLYNVAKLSSNRTDPGCSKSYLMTMTMRQLRQCNSIKQAAFIK